MLNSCASRSLMIGVGAALMPLIPQELAVQERVDEELAQLRSKTETDN